MYFGGAGVPDDAGGPFGAAAIEESSLEVGRACTLITAVKAAITEGKRMAGSN